MSGDRVLPIYIGWDSREPVAFDVCAYSLWRRTSIPLMISPLKLNALRHFKFVWREDDLQASTEFTFTRFLTPILARRSGLSGWALFCDCDFLWLADVAELTRLFDPAVAVMVVKHEHRPTETVKMDGRRQAVYPRKNWSSLVAFNLDHESNKRLSLEAVNNQEPSWLHQFCWLRDDEIGALPEAWNWLEGHSPPNIEPKAVHFTRGGPWFPNWRNVAHADDWNLELSILTAQLRPALPLRNGLPVSEAE